MIHQRGYSPILIILGSVILLGVIGGVYVLRMQSPKSSQVTQQANQLANQSQLNKLDAQQSATPEVAKDATNWVTYTNTKFLYELKYPSVVEPIVVQENLEETANLRLNDMSRKIQVLPPNGSPAYNVTPHFFIEAYELKKYEKDYPVFKLELKEFAEKLWLQNKNHVNPNFPNRKISDLSQITIDNKQAYTFTLDGDFDSDTADYVLDFPSKYILFEYKGTKYIVRLPVDDKIFDQVLSTFKFKV